MTPAPVVVFAYARPEHTAKALAALADNPLAADSELYVYIDGPKGLGDEARVARVGEVVDRAGGFGAKTVIRRPRNLGLAQNIIDGVTEVCARHGRVIVLEDDAVTSPNFLQFMNEALGRYAEEPRVWHVSGWNYPIDPEGLDDSFFWRVMNCWGWATWADRWAYFEKDPARLVREWSRSKIKRFNLDGAHDFWAQVVANHKGELNTWAIFWYATIFEHDGLCLNPVRSLVRNIGHDGTGENCEVSDELAFQDIGGEIGELPERIAIDEAAVTKIKEYFSARQPGMITRRVKRLNTMIRERLGR